VSRIEAKKRKLEIGKKRRTCKKKDKLGKICKGKKGKNSVVQNTFCNAHFTISGIFLAKSMTFTIDRKLVDHLFERV